MEERQFLYKHAGKEYAVEYANDDTFEELKRKIEVQTNIMAKRQKVLGVKTTKGSLAADEDSLSDCLLKPGQRYMVLGQPEAVILAASVAPEEPEVIDDLLDPDPNDPKALREASQRSLEEALDRREGKANVKVLNAPRPGKKCLVLDIDYTFFDMSSVAERPSELLRPYLHELLKAVYPHYDIVVWSATSLRWIEIKLRELGISRNLDYKISILMDGTCMVPIAGPQSGKHYTCKPLAFLWRLHPCYGPKNTIMADDLKRNFVFNKRNGYIIPPYRHCHQNWATDTELLWFKYYLLLIKDKRDLSKLDHREKQMKAYVSGRILPSELRQCTHPQGEASTENRGSENGSSMPPSDQR